jgi:hypothetical protein
MRVNFLFDFYHDLLTEKQQKYMRLYYLEDFSLSEISEVFSVSRQAVYDNIKRTESMLETYEGKLRLYEKFRKRTLIIEEIDQHVTDEKIKELLNQLKELD